MMMTLPSILAGLGLAAGATAAGDAGGLAMTLTPSEARPGDLITLQVAMSREQYGEFTLDFPAHPRLRLLSRERIPLRICNGRYLQGERLVLQPVSSGSLVVTGTKARLTEKSGVREMDLPELCLTVLPFESADDNPAPEPFPMPEVRRTTRFPLSAAGLAGVLAAILLGFFFFRGHSRREAAG